MTDPAATPDAPDARPALTVVVPAYDEAGTVGESLPRLHAELERLDRPFEILLVSDGSHDATAGVAQALGLAHLRVEHYEPNRGKGYALRYGLSRATSPYVAFIDADLDIHPRSIGPLLAVVEAGDADVCVGSKVHPGSHISYPPFRRVQSRVFRLLVRVAFGLDVADTQTGLKVFTRDVVTRCLPLVHTDGFAFDVELLVLANDAGFRIVEGPVELDFHFTSSTGARTVADVLREMRAIWLRRRAARRSGAWVRPGA